MKTLIPVVFLAATATIVHAQGQPFVQRLYTEFGWETSTPMRRLAFKRETVTGSFWVVSVNGEKHIVTAGHNLGLANGKLAVVPKEESRVLSTFAETLLGRFAYRISTVALPNQKNDWVALTPESPAVLERSRAFTLAEKSPEIGERVQVWGFAGQPHPKPLSLTVVDVSEGRDFLTLSERLSSGYSGGVVLNDNGQAVAVVVATKTEHSTALVLKPGSFQNLVWKPVEQLHGTAGVSAENRAALQQIIEKYDLDADGYLNSDERDRMEPADRDILNRLEKRLGPPA